MTYAGTADARANRLRHSTSAVKRAVSVSDNDGAEVGRASASLPRVAEIAARGSAGVSLGPRHDVSIGASHGLRWRLTWRAPTVRLRARLRCRCSSARVRAT